MTHPAYPDESQPDVLVLRRVDTITTHTNLPAGAWKYATPPQKQSFVNDIRGNILAALEQKFPNCFYDLVGFNVTDTPQDGSLLAMAPDKTLQRIVRATCVANVFTVVVAQPSEDDRAAFLNWAEQANTDGDTATVIEALANLWAQGVRPGEGRAMS